MGTQGISGCQKDMCFVIITSIAIVDKWIMMKTTGVVGTGMRTLTSNLYSTSPFARIIKNKAPPMSIAKILV